MLRTFPESVATIAELLERDFEDEFDQLTLARMLVKVIELDRIRRFASVGDDTVDYVKAALVLGQMRTRLLDRLGEYAIPLSRGAEDLRITHARE